MIYYRFISNSNILNFMNNNNQSIWDFMTLFNISQNLNPLYLFLRFIGRAATSLFIIKTVFEFVDKTQKIE